MYGTMPVLEALRSRPGRLRRILIAEGSRESRLTEILDLAAGNKVPFDRVERQHLDRIVEPGANHQGIVAIAAAAEYLDEDELLDSLPAEPLLVLLDTIEDPRNLGAILRTAECAGADGVFLPNRRSAGLTEAAVKTSAGAAEYLKIARTANLNRLIDNLKSRGIWIVGADGAADMDYTEWDWSLPTALVLGSEGSGLRRLVSENCDSKVRIPMYGKINSLNVSVAAGVLLFEARRRRKSKDRTKDGE
ncbi:MAG: 23S rRNA (guanosine(2251)-2'-O)-methyltransferase RlmB [Acidobacteriota bacterium]